MENELYQLTQDELKKETYRKYDMIKMCRECGGLKGECECSLLHRIIVSKDIDVPKSMIDIVQPLVKKGHKITYVSCDGVGVTDMDNDEVYNYIRLSTIRIVGLYTRELLDDFNEIFDKLTKSKINGDIEIASYQKVKRVSLSIYGDSYEYHNTKQHDCLRVKLDNRLNSILKKLKKAL